MPIKMNGTGSKMIHQKKVGKLDPAVQKCPRELGLSVVSKRNRQQ